MPGGVVSSAMHTVALPAEGVDRNRYNWCLAANAMVALPAEGVDRNSKTSSAALMIAVVALPTEGVDRNRICRTKRTASPTSPSPRRAWIEISTDRRPCYYRASPSPRRAWIEIGTYPTVDSRTKGRPPHGGRG